MLKNTGKTNGAGREAGAAEQEAAEGPHQVGVLKVQPGGEAEPGAQQVQEPVAAQFSQQDCQEVLYCQPGHR